MHIVIYFLPYEAIFTLHKIAEGEGGSFNIFRLQVGGNNTSASMDGKLQLYNQINKFAFVVMWVLYILVRLFEIALHVVRNLLSPNLY